MCAWIEYGSETLRRSIGLLLALRALCCLPVVVVWCLLCCHTNTRTHGGVIGGGDGDDGGRTNAQFCFLFVSMDRAHLFGIGSDVVGASVLVCVYVVHYTLGLFDARLLIVARRLWHCVNMCGMCVRSRICIYACCSKWSCLLRMVFILLFRCRKGWQRTEMSFLLIPLFKLIRIGCSEDYYWRKTLI